MSKYRLATADPDGPVVVAANNTNIPNDPNNREWQRYRFWRSLGNTPDPFTYTGTALPQQLPPHGEPEGQPPPAA